MFWANWNYTKIEGARNVWKFNKFGKVVKRDWELQWQWANNITRSQQGRRKQIRVTG